MKAVSGTVNSGLSVVMSVTFKSAVPTLETVTFRSADSPTGILSKSNFVVETSIWGTTPEPSNEITSGDSSGSSL